MNRQHHSLNDPEYMQMLEDNLPHIEEETGVKLRFLAGFWRHSDIEWNLDDADRLMSIAKSPYIVGCDFMGHEINSTLDFKDVLKALTRYAVTEDPEFVIRVHAGENPIFKTNVYDALKTISDEHEAVQNEQGRAMQMPQVRIGHGLYGLDIQEDGNWNALEEGAVLKLAKKMGAIVEFNMSSNLALKNINDISEVPIKRYLDAGIDVVLGTDGHGMYSTFNGQETVLAIAAGVTVADLTQFSDEINKLFAKPEEYSYSNETKKHVDEMQEKFCKDLLFNIQNGKTNLRTGGEGMEHLIKELFECQDSLKNSYSAKKSFSSFPNIPYCKTKRLIIVFSQRQKRPNYMQDQPHRFYPRETHFLKLSASPFP